MLILLSYHISVLFSANQITTGESICNFTREITRKSYKKQNRLWRNSCNGAGKVHRMEIPAKLLHPGAVLPSSLEVFQEDAAWLLQHQTKKCCYTQI